MAKIHHSWKAFIQLEAFQIFLILFAILGHLLEWGQDYLPLQTFLVSTGAKWTQAVFFWNRILL